MEVKNETRASKIGLPPRLFLYTLDQISAMTQITEDQLAAQYIYFEGRSSGQKLGRHMLARNIAQDPTAPPDWRVAEMEVLRWYRFKGFRFYESMAVKY